MLIKGRAYEQAAGRSGSEAALDWPRVHKELLAIERSVSWSAVAREYDRQQVLAAAHDPR